MTIASLVNRGFNLLATTILALGGVTFGSVFFQEADPSDKVDDGGFLIIAAVALGWYFWPGNRSARSLAPIVIAGAAVAVQVMGLVL
jgi:hypothetical protein